MDSQFIFAVDGALTPSCHASTIVETAAGALLCAWFGGTREGAGDVGIWLARSEGGGWSAPVEVAADERHPCWNPVLFRPREGPLLLFLKVGASPARWWGEVIASADDARTWTARRRLPDGIFGPVKNKPVQLGDCTVVCPSSTEHDGWRVRFELTSDLGETWTTAGPVGDGRTLPSIQPTILTHPGGRLQALCRSTRGVISQTWSDDDGRTWTDLTPTELPNPNSGIDAVTLQDGRHLMVYNPITRGRHRLSVALSDDGLRWRDVAGREQDHEHEYSYPAVIQAADGAVHVTYTYRRRTIRHVVIGLAELG